MSESLVVQPTDEPNCFRLPDGRTARPPVGWSHLPAGDAGLTRRVKSLGPSWTVIVVRKRRQISLGVFAPAENIQAARQALEVERADPAYARRREQDAARRARKQEAYVQDFAEAVFRFLRFAPGFHEQALDLAAAVAAHATPVGSGTVARTETIPVEQRAEAAVIAWLRHQATAYDHLQIARVKGLRREVRREINQIARELLQLHRVDVRHAAQACPLCTALLQQGRERA